MHKFAGVLIAVIALLFVSAPMPAIAKGKMTVKISPEPTRFKKSAANSAPRDAASGQAVGKRIHKPIHVITPANVMKTKHDTVKNSISNIR